MGVIRDIYLFLHDVFWRWQSWAGGSGLGGAVTVIISLWERSSGQSLSKAVYFSIIVGGFLLGAVFMAWRDKRKELTAALADLDTERLANLPHLVGRIDQTIIGEFPPQLKRAGCMCLLNVSVINKGAPSIVQSWAVSLTLNDVAKNVVLEVLQDVTLRMNGQSIQVVAADAIYDKTISPIPRGGLARGWLLCWAQDMTHAEASSGAEWRVTFEDYEGRSYSAMHRLTQESVLDTPQYHPGSLSIIRRNDG